MARRTWFTGILAATCVAMVLLTASVGHTQTDTRVQKSMERLKAMTAAMGAPKVEGTEAVGGKNAPALYFGTTKMNNNFDVVDAIGTEDGQGMTATLFGKRGRRIHPGLDECAQT
jgi:hypothetical protein